MSDSGRIGSEKRSLDSIGIVRRVLRDVLQLGSRADDLRENSPLLGAIPELDSLAVVTILTLFEEEFRGVIRDDEVSAQTFETVGSLATFLDERLTKRISS